MVRLLVLVAMLPGCLNEVNHNVLGSHTCGDGFIDPDQGEECDGGDRCRSNCRLIEPSVKVGWTLFGIETEMPEPVAGTQTRIRVEPIDAAGNPFGIPMSTAVPFEATQPVSMVFPADLDQQAVRVTVGLDGYGDAQPIVVALAEPGRRVDALFYDDGGYFFVEWELRGTGSNELMTCEQAGITELTITLRETTTQQQTEHPTPCSPSHAVVGPKVAGTYEVFLQGATGPNTADLAGHNSTTTVAPFVSLVPGV